VRDAGWKRTTLIVLIAVVVVAGAAVGLFWWRATAHADSVKAYKSKTTTTWNTIAGKANAVTASLLRVTTPDDLGAVAADATALKKDVDSASATLKGSGSPAGYKDEVDKETAALDSLSRYLDMVSQLASQADPNAVISNRALVEDRARQAQDDTNDFLSAAKWMSIKMPGDFYQSGQTLQAAFQPPNPALEADKQAVYDTVNTFMNADIFHQNLDLLWSMLTNRLHTGFAYFNVTKDRLMAGWTKAWGDHKPVNYYISKTQIDFPSPGTANVKTFVYLEHGTPRIEDVRLVNEGGVWKIDSYPYVGWL
jgi:hypothetical protein